jgi:replication factor C small subunit
MGQDAISVFQAFVRFKNVVDCNLVGPAGCGKTTTVKCLFNELYAGVNDFGVPYVDENTLIMNASDERKLDDIRTKVMGFTTYASTHPEVPFRTIYLDEVDGLLGLAQDALKAIIEACSKNCRFILSCNDLSKLILPLQSRGPSIPFYKIADTDMLKVLASTCTQHNVTITEDAAKLLILSSDGDLRKMLKSLQMAAMVNQNITIETVLKFINKVNDSVTEKILQFAFANDFESARLTLEELYSSSHYDAPAILVSIGNNVVKLRESFPNPVAYWKATSKVRDALVQVKTSAMPLFVIYGLITDLILINNSPLKCIQMKE